MLDLWQNNQAVSAQPSPEEGRDLPATFGESFDAAWSNGRLFSDSLAGTNARTQAMEEYAQKIRDAGGNLIGGLYGPNALDLANNTLAGLKAKNPALQLQPMTQDDLDRRGVEISRGAAQSAADMAQREKTLGGSIGMAAGGLAAGAADPINIPAAVVAPEAEIGVLGTGLLFGAYGAASQQVNEGLQAHFREQVQPGYAASGAAGENVLEAGVSGAVLGAGFKTLGNLWTRLKTGSWPTSIRDAGNIVESEANIQQTNVLPGVEGEVAHREALSSSINQILQGQAVDAPMATASRALMARLESERPFSVPIADMRGIALTSEEAALRERSAALQEHVAGLPEGDPAAAETLSRLEVVERGLGEAQTADERRTWSQRRDELLTDTNPETLRERAAPLEQRRVAIAQQASIESRLNDIAAERAKLTPTEPTTPFGIGQTSAVPRTLFDIHEQRIDNMMEMRTQAGSAEPEMQPTFRYGLEGGVRGLSHLTGYDMPREEATRLSDRIMESRSDDEARAIMNEISARPRTIADTLPSASEIDRAVRADVPREIPDRAVLDATRPDAIAQTVASPQHDAALQSGVERAIDDAAKSGKKAVIPIGVDEKGEPIYGSLASALDDIAADRDAADQLESCINPSAEAAE